MNKSARTPARQPLTPPSAGVAVRMYRLGLGECTLLAFDAGEDRRPNFMLIDCGVHPAQPNGIQDLAKALDDIAAVTEGRLDVLVATHDHPNQSRGFSLEADRFLRRELVFDHLWAPWTENLEDPLARPLLRKRNSARAAIRSTLKRLTNGDGDSETGLAQKLQELGIALNDPSLGLSDSTDLGTDQPWDALKGVARQVHYLRPGSAPIDIPGAITARAYVLGPARADNPSLAAGVRNQQAHMALAGLDSYATAAGGQNAPNDTPEIDLQDMCQPFGQEYRISFRQAKELEFFGSHYGFKRDDPQAWRAINRDWLYAAEALAADANTHSCNASLALALEVGAPGTGRVLLFTSNAQAQDWLSWNGLRWRHTDGQESTLGIADLFRRTAIYKVGQHGSRYATIKQDERGASYGLELMPRGVIALLYVDETVSHGLPGGDLPAASLFAALRRKTQGNLLRSDDIEDDYFTTPTHDWTPVPDIPDAQWRCSSAKNSANSALYYDILLSGEPRMRQRNIDG